MLLNSILDANMFFVELLRRKFAMSVVIGLAAAAGMYAVCTVSAYLAGKISNSFRILLN